MQATTPRCYSGDTEILTRTGWKLLPDLAAGDEVATRSENGQFEWQMPGERSAIPFAGNMVEFSSKSIELLVTPSHRMLVKHPDAYLAKHTPRDGKTDWHIRPAEHIARAPETRWLYLATSSWTGNDPGEFRIPGTPSFRHPAREFAVPAHVFCAFLGIYLAEGWVRKDRNDIRVAQSPSSRHFAKITEILAATGLNWNYDAKNSSFVTTHKTLAIWLREHTGQYAWGKRIPAGIKDFSSQLLERLLSAAMLGDGHWGPEGQRYYTTTSARLADDVQEIFQKLGRDAWVRQHNLSSYDAGVTGTGREIRRSGRMTYVVRERMQSYHWLPIPKRTGYCGTVYGVAVPNGIVYVRRNGKAAWSGS